MVLFCISSQHCNYMNMHTSSTGSCSKGTSSKHPQNTLGHLCFSLIQRSLLLCSFWIIDLCRLIFFFIPSICLFLLDVKSKYVCTGLCAPQTVETTAQQELRAPLSNQCCLCLQCHRWGRAVGVCVVYKVV